MNVALLAPEEVGPMWPALDGMVRAALAEGAGEYEPEDVRDLCARGEWGLAVAHEGERIAALCACGPVDYPRKRFLWVHLGAGADAKALVPLFLPVLRRAARALGCDALGMQGRVGWERSGALPGWRRVAGVWAAEV